MKIRKRQNRLYELFNGKNKVRYVAVSVAYIHLFIILVLYNIFNTWSFELCVINILLSFIILIRIILKNFLKRFYYPRFNPSSYYAFSQNKFNFNKLKSKDIKNNKAIIATRKYIDRHYSHIYDADELLLRLKNVKSNYDIFAQLPSNYIIGIVTGLVSGFLTSNVLKGENAISIMFNIILYIISNLIIITVLYYSIKSFYSEYDSIIMPYEISKIKQQLSYIDDIYSNV